MSGANWIRVDADLLSSQEFLVITDRVALSASLPEFLVENFVLGCLTRLWLHCDSHGWMIEDGDHQGDAVIEGITPRLLAKAIGDSGQVVVDALLDVGWLIQAEDGVRLPNIGRRSPKGCRRNRTSWARKSSKLAVQSRREAAATGGQPRSSSDPSRVKTGSNQVIDPGQCEVFDPGQTGQVRVSEVDNPSGKPHVLTESVTESVTERGTTEQNRTEQEKRDMVKPPSGSTESDRRPKKQRSTTVKISDQQFAVFWSEVPRRVKKAESRKRLALVVRDLIKAGDSPDVEAAVEFLTAQARHWRQLHEQDGTEPQFIEHPTTWLNGRRWEDYAEGSNSRSDAPPAEFEQIVGQYLDRSLRDEFGASAPLLWKRDEAEFRAAHPELWKWAKRHRPELLTAIEPQSARSARLAELREVA